MSAKLKHPREMSKEEYSQLLNRLLEEGRQLDYARDVAKFASVHHPWPYPLNRWIEERMGEVMREMGFDPMLDPAHLARVKEREQEQRKLERPSKKSLEKRRSDALSRLESLSLIDQVTMLEATVEWAVRVPAQKPQGE